MLVTNSPKFQIIGHRGNPGNPLNSSNIENTIKSFKDAWNLGADGIELDAILSKDGILIVHHDDYLGRVFLIPDTEKQGLIGEYTANDLIFDTAINVEGLTKDLSTKEAHPALHDALATIPRLSSIPIPKDKKLFLELKFIKDVYDKDSPNDRRYLEGLVKKAVEFIEEKGIADQVYVLSFVPEALDRVKELNPNIVTAHNIYQGEASDPSKVKQLKKDFGFDIMNPPFEQATKTAIYNIKSEGLQTYPWVWNQSPEEEIAETVRLIKDGSDGSINNQVKAALEIRDRYSVRV